jgi:hypothetical protein
MIAAFIADVSRWADIDEGRGAVRRLFTDSYGLHALFAYRLGRWLLRTGRKYYLWPLLPMAGRSTTSSAAAPGWRTTSGSRSRLTSARVSSSATLGGSG